MKDRHILLADDSLTGILSAVSYAYKSRYGHDYNEIRIDDGTSQPELFSRLIKIPADTAAAENVYSAVINKIGIRAAELVENASISFYADRAEAVYRFLIYGFRIGPSVTDRLGDAEVARMNDISRNVGNETNHWVEFVRFAAHDAAEVWHDNEADILSPAAAHDNSGEILTSVIEPKNRIMPRIMPHFADRFPGECFVIYDSIHDTAGIHVPGREWFLRHGFKASDPELVSLVSAQNEHDSRMQELWKIFFKATDIPERANEKVQNSLLPKWLRKNMTEFM